MTWRTSVTRADGDAGAAAQGRRRRFSVDALFADHRPQATGVSDLPTAKEILLDRIVPDPEQPRRTFDPDKLDELAASIRIEGVLQPIVVRYDEERDTYVVVHGERRWRAARLAGLDRLPAIVRDVPPERRLIQQLMENIVRDDLNPIDRAAALRGLKAQLGDAPWDEVAEAVGIRRSRLFQLLGTEKLSERVQDDIRAGRLSEKQSRAMQGLPPAAQEALRVAVVREGLGATEAMRLGRELRAAGVADDPREVAATLERLRSTAPTPQAGADENVWQGPDQGEIRGQGAGGLAGLDEVTHLLAAIAAAVGGGRSQRQALLRAADAMDASPFAVERLQAEVEALARSLARVPSLAIRPGGQSYRALDALRSALDALLSKQ